MPLEKGTRAGRDRPRPKPKRPKRPSPVPSAQKQATVWAAEQNLRPWEVPVRPPRPRGKPRAVGRPASLEDRYRAAIAAPVSREARRQLAETMSPRRREEVRNPRLPPPPPPAPTGLRRLRRIAEIASGRSAAETAAAFGEAFVARPLWRGLEAAAAEIRPSTQRIRRPGGQFGPVERGGIPAAAVTRLPELGEMAGKVLAGGGVGAVTAITDPAKAARESIEILRGTGDAVAATAALLQPEVTFAQRRKISREIATQTYRDWMDMYGGDVTWDELVDKAQERPVIALLNAAAVAAPAAKVGSVVNFMRRGATLSDAVRLSRDPSLADEVLGPGKVRGARRMLTVRQRYGQPVTQVEARWSRSPLYRGVQRARDVAMGAAERLPGPAGRAVRRLPISQTSQALRVTKRQLGTATRRRAAQGMALWQDVQRLTKAEPETAASLFWTLQRPADVPEDTWLRALLEDAEQMLEGRPVEVKERVSPAEARLQRRLDSFRRQLDAATQAKWAGKVEDLYDEAVRLEAASVDIGHEIRRVRADDTIPDDERAGRLRALERQRAAIREELATYRVEEPPVESARRTQLASAIEELPNIDAEQGEALMRILDTRAHAWARQTGRNADEWYEDPDGLGLAEIRMIEDAADVPAQALAQISFNLERAIPPEVAQQNLRYVKGGDLYKPQLGRQRNKRVFRTVNGQRVQVIGRITAPEWVKRVKAIVPDKAERDRLARWYEEVAPTFERFFGDDAEAILRGFAVSQANASPTSGLQATLRVFDKLEAGEPISDREISAVVKSIEAAVEGKHVSSGLAAKLHDFADSIQGKRTRTWMGDDPRGGRPTANDVHAIRDLGYVDKKLVARLRNPEAGAMYSRGLRDEDFQIDSPGSPGTHQYERMREQYEEITDHLNEIGFDGRRDWQPAEVQALGWSAIQRLHGAYPENLVDAVRNNTRRINLEVTKGRSGIGDDLTLAEAGRVAQAVTPVIRDMIEETDGLYLDSEISIGLSGYEGASNASLHFDLIGSPETVHGLVTRLADAFDQYDVWATRESSSTGAKPTLLVAHPDLGNPETALRLFTELHATDRRRFAGFTTVEVEGVPGISLVMPGKAVTEASYAARKADLGDTLDAAVDRVLGDVSYNYRLANTQVIDREWKGGKGQRPRIQEAKARRALDDPLAAEARRRLDEAVTAVRAQRPAEAPQVLAQTRRSELNGAVQFLNSEDGARILYLTRSADVSTLLHELVGHGAREMKRHYAREFSEVETMFGAKLEDWSELDHERFARMSERYFSEGYAPTPELVPVFRHLKRWMRSIYGAMRNITEPLPPQVRVLFDRYFGAYDDPNVFRVAQMQTRIPEDVKTARGQALFDYTSGELATLRRRNDTRAYNRSIEGLKERLARMGDYDDLDLEGKERYEALHSQILTLEAERELVSVEREGRLRSRYSELEKALANPRGRRYDGAVDALRGLTQMREEIIRSVFGDQFDPVFRDRVDLLADWLADHGLLGTSDFERGTARYVRHEAEEAREARAIAPPARSLTNDVIGATDRSRLDLAHRNNLMRWQSGDLNADPIVVFKAWQNAQAFAFVHFLKERMWAIGRPLAPDEEPPPGTVVVHRQGKPTPDLDRAETPPAATDNVQEALNALESGNPDELERSVATYANDVFLGTREQVALKRAQAGGAENVEMRVVDKRVVDALFRPVTGSASRAGQAWDLGSTIGRWSLIYANPAYIPTNFVGNTFFLLGQQGPRALSNLVRASRIGLKNRKLAIRIAAETGDLPAEAAISRGRGSVSARTRQREQRALQVYTAIPDRIPRMAAWIYEAGRLGYRTEDDLFRLLDGSNEQLRSHRDAVSERASEIMVRFDRLSDFERQTVTRVLFIWPWIRGATAWPFYYAREFPVQTAIAANVGATTEERRQAMMGEVPSYRRELFPIEAKRGGKMRVMNLASITPGGTAAESVSAIYANLASALGGEDIELGERLIDYVNPVLEMSLQIGAAQSGVGERKPIRDIIGENAWSFVPLGSMWQQMLDPSTQSKIFDRKTARAALNRRMFRIRPEDVSLSKLQAFQQQQGAKLTVTEQVEKEQQNLRSRAGKFGVEIDGTVTRQIGPYYALKAAKEQEKERIKESSSWQPGRTESGAIRREPILHPYQEALITHRVLERYFPGQAETIPEPPRDYWNYTDAQFEEYTRGLEDILFGELASFKRQLSKAEREKKAG